MKRIIAAILVALSLGAHAASAQIRDPIVVEIWNRGATAYNNGEMDGFLAAMLELEQRRPHQLPMLYNVAVGYALTDQTERAMEKLESIAAAGLYIDVEADDDFASLRDHPQYERLLRAMDAIMVETGESTVYREFDLRGMLPEGVALDEITGAMFISSVQLGQIWRVTDSGSLEDFVLPGVHQGLGGIFGMAVDQDRGLLWATSSLPGQYVGPNRSNNPPTALFAFDLQTGALRHYMPVSGEGHFLGDVVVAPDGGVYASDSGVPVIFRANDELTVLTPFYANDQFTNFQGFDFDDQGRVYIADYVHGVILADPASRQVYRLGVEDGTNLSGIDGLFFFEGSLVAIRNGVPPLRIMRLHLSDDGTRITRTDVLAANLALWDEPTLGQIVGDRLIYNATSGWPDFTDDGEIAQGAQLDPIRIMSVSVE